MKVFQALYEDKHFENYIRNGLLVDSGIFIDFLFWKCMNQKQKDSLSKKEKESLENLERFLSVGFKKMITPHVLAEISNRARHKGDQFGGSNNVIKKMKNLMIVEYEEEPIKREDLFGVKELETFGVADTGLLFLSKTNNSVILADDNDFCVECKFKQNLPLIERESIEYFVNALSWFKK